MPSKRPIPSMRFYAAAVMLSAVAGLTACVPAPIVRHEGASVPQQGYGGARERIGDIDFWTHGSPPGEYRVIGYTTVESQDDLIGRRILLSRVAAQVRRAGGNAAIRISETSKPSIAYQAGGVSRIENRRIVEIAIIQYRD
ncbi:hypothetical protein [Noviherbaspirillum sp.]|uniref:hypothetical protein n=1 Tax=Noviherbaspirillum sp. TaxID=1926288 RepID=UPI002D4D0A60|nr:hypothetical protein [Noviherbaspirillum sp.]HZW19743.1 hypothetical protein [Noviherbaspirillum sp.]